MLGGGGIPSRGENDSSFAAQELLQQLLLVLLFSPRFAPYLLGRVIRLLGCLKRVTRRQALTIRYSPVVDAA